jgi:hypothetical protein
MADDESTNIPGAAAKLGGALIGALPPAFLLLCIINVVFLGLVMWFLADQIDRRTALVSHIVPQSLDST